MKNKILLSCLLLSTNMAMANNSYNIIISKNNSINYEIENKTENEITCDLALSLTRTQLIQKIDNKDDLTNLNVSCVTDFSYLFSPDRLSANPSSISTLTSASDLYNFNQDISNWDVSSGVNFEGMFKDASSFNQNIGSWNVSNGINFKDMFNSADVFNKNINNWNMKNADSIEGMFAYAYKFNQPLNNWNVSKVRAFTNTFNSAYDFNQPLNDWDISNGFIFMAMFANTTSFNQPLNKWNPSSAFLMSQMFFSASKFNQDISNWNVLTVVSFDNFKILSALEDKNTPPAALNVGPVGPS